MVKINLLQTGRDGSCIGNTKNRRQSFKEKKWTRGENKDISLDEKLALIADAVLKSELKLDSMFEFAHKRPQDIDDNMIKAFGYQTVKEKINEVDYKVSHFFRQK